HSSIFAVMVAVWLVAIAGFVIAKASLESLTVDRVKNTAELRALLYKQIWDGALTSELSQLLTLASFPAVVQGVMQPETHTQALRQTVVDSLRKKSLTAATVVDFEGNPLVEVGHDDVMPRIPSETLPAILMGNIPFDITFERYNNSLIVQFILPIMRKTLHEELVEGAIITREPIENIYSQIHRQREPTDGRLVLAAGDTELLTVGSVENNQQLPIEVDIASTRYTLKYYPQLGLEKALLNERLLRLAASFGAALTVCMGVGYVLIDRLLKHPLSLFLEAIEVGKNSGSAVPIEQRSRFTEIRQLTDRYNDMMREISSRQKELAGLNKSLREKVVVQSRELAAMQTTNAKMQFLSGVSHELRTPLHGILGFTRLGLEKSQHKKQPDMERYFTKIERNADTLLTLVDDVLHLTKTKDSFDAESVSEESVHDLINHVVEDMEAYIAESSIEVRVIDKSDNVIVNVDAVRIQQVIRNLLSNAVRYSKARSSVDIEITKQGPYCQIRVMDNGVGIPADELESIFDAFTQSSRTDKRAGGTGLGLAISRAIVANHGGRIAAENRPYGGACFSVKLPLPGLGTLAA
ncbi:MAG: HAMP domain-containing sensor histidine kinase, partial [Pseudomonadota bacterium]